MMKAGIVGLAFTLFAAPAGAQPNRDPALHAFLQERFAEDRASFPDTRYAHGWADLNGDGRPEAFVYIMSGNYCGSGGCNLFIYTPEQNSFHQLARMTVINPPVRVLNSRSRGWSEITVGVAGGGARAGTALLQYGRYSYPENPTVAPARRIYGERRGQTVIAAEPQSRPLF